MRIICVLSLAILVGCSRQSTVTEESAVSKRVPSEVRLLTNLIGNDPNKDLLAHPLICDDKGDYPKGRELIFLKSGTKEVVHAVFPDKVKSPRDLTGTFVLKGYYQGIQKKDRFKARRKELIDNYRYFIVISWSKKNLEQGAEGDAVNRAP
jgi:hypothetical protein